MMQRIMVPLDGSTFSESALSTAFRLARRHGSTVHLVRVHEPKIPVAGPEGPPLYDPVLEPLGVRLTRGALIDISNEQYVRSNEGHHLALYVEPISDYSNDQYVAGFWNVTALITPDVFARWPDLESYDICQEPLPSVDDGPEPFPITQINLTREAAATIDWTNGELVDLLVAARTNEDVRVVVNREVRESPTYAAADGAARTKAASATSTTRPGGF